MSDERRFDLAEVLSRLPAQPLAAVRLLRLLADGSESSLAELADVVNLDPALSVRVLRAANAPYRGRPRRVRSAERAVVLLGFDTVTAVAAAAACRLMADDVDLGPPDFWAHSLTVATGASVSADAVGVLPADAFTAALQHDIGAAVLHRVDSVLYAEAAAAATIGERLAAERAAFGIDHPGAGALALEEWHFPPAMVEAIRSHHEPIDTASPLAQAVMVGEALADRVDPEDRPEDGRELEALLRDLRLPATLAGSLVARTATELDRVQAEIGSPA